MRMNDPTALKLLREIAQDSANVVFMKHAHQRMKQRRATPVQVLECLKKGVVRESVALDLYDNWKLTVAHRVAGVELNVSVAIELPKRAIVITAFWS